MMNIVAKSFCKILLKLFQMECVAVAIVEKYRPPPSCKWENRTQWVRTEETDQAIKFEERNKQGKRTRCTAILVLSKSTSRFTMKLRRSILTENPKHSLVVVLHFGMVPAEIKNLNVDRADNLEVWETKSLFTSSVPFQFQLITTDEVPRLLQDIGVEDRGAISQVKPWSPEVVFTGGQEGDIVQSQSVEGARLFLVVPSATDESESEKLFSILQQSPTKSRRCVLFEKIQRELVGCVAGLPRDEAEALEAWAEGPGDLDVSLLANVSPTFNEVLTEYLKSLTDTDYDQVWRCVCSAVFTGRQQASWREAVLLDMESESDGDEPCMEVMASLEESDEEPALHVLASLDSSSEEVSDEEHIVAIPSLMMQDESAEVCAYRTQCRTSIENRGVCEDHRASWRQVRDQVARAAARKPRSRANFWKKMEEKGFPHVLRLVLSDLRAGELPLSEEVAILDSCLG